jgi:predicted acylesterase/phospholipase RssA
MREMFRFVVFLLIFTCPTIYSLRLRIPTRSDARSFALKRWYQNVDSLTQKVIKKKHDTSNQLDQPLYGPPLEPQAEVKKRWIAPQRRRLGVIQPPITTADELRHLVLDQGMELKKVAVQVPVSNSTTMFNASNNNQHDVLQLLARRFHSGSTPGHRHKHKDSQYKLALCLEGGGMRGAVTAGMAAAIAVLGLTDAFDAVYGSSAGSVIGAYMTSRQMCLDVYVDLLPAAKRRFVCVKRMARGMARNAADLFFLTTTRYYNKNDTSTTAATATSAASTPGMNISFVLDGIMHETHGLRPLDIERFRANDKLQPLRVASSFVKNGKLRTQCFGTTEFFPDEQGYVVQRADGTRQGLYACLEASMAVPGATGPPVPLLIRNETVSFFDAFCFEPLPYRSAVEEGATHVLVCASRPEGFQPKTRPGVYERGVASMHFRSHREPEVARFFERGGQQYIYAEDLLTLEEGKNSKEPVIVPPPKVFYGVDRDLETEAIARDRSTWKKAHILPLKVPLGTPELSSLSQDRGEVLSAVRGGFAAAFDLLAPAIGLKLDQELTGEEIARLVFPEECQYDEESLMALQMHIVGDAILESRAGRGKNEGGKTLRRVRKRDIFRRLYRRLRRRKTDIDVDSNDTLDEFSFDNNPVEMLLSRLPGLQAGQMTHFVQNLESNFLNGQR